MGDDPAEPEIPGERQQDQAAERQGGDPHEGQEKELTYAGAEVELGFEEVVGQVNAEDHPDGDERTPDQVIQVVFPDKGIQFLDQVFVIPGSAHAMATDKRWLWSARLTTGV